MKAQNSKPESPAKQIAGFISKFDPAIAKLARAARRALQKRFPAAIELVYDNYNALAIGYAPNERTSEVFFSLAVYASGVNLYFMQGAKLRDPGKLLQGRGNQGRFIRLENVSQLDEPAASALMLAAIQFGKTPLNDGKPGYTVIKSISAKQRPRRLSKNN